MGGVGVKGGHIGVQLPGVQLPLMGGQRDHLVARILDRPGLMDVDVPGLGGDDGLVPAQQGGDHHEIGLRAAGEEVHVRFRAAEGADFIGGPAAPEVLAVARLGDEIRFRESLQHLGVAALGIIA